jgi:hypothetical protein
MTFQAYLDNIRAKSGKTPDDFHKAAKKAGLLAPGVKAMQIVDWLKTEYGLGHGHAMAIFAVFKSKGWFGEPEKASAKPKAKSKATPKTKAKTKRAT